ncbi:DNA-binding protein [Gilliamella apicola]|uniref:DNA-binding protein n=1 Tax=Gilliamella apicola TaxID=1196095 RepID=A0A2V4E2Y0_9GAMM|nr:AlpA family transcriptional regulator [Gilliamella apicola]PXZ07590.1 DNA-binding protein [Gilliamella apicola]
MSKILLRLPKVMEKTGLKRATIYFHIKQNTFPKQFKIGQRAVAWLESDIDDWIDGYLVEMEGKGE